MQKTMKKERKVSVNNTYPKLACKASEIRAMYRFLDEAMRPDAIPEGELSIALVGEAEIIRMHKQFLGDPSVTDVITFPGDPGEKLAGEICVCADFAAAQAPKFSQSFEKEMTLYLAHGWLHLAGYDDIDENNRVKMRLAETRAMDEMEKNGKIPHFSQRT
jgi:probable rRNA maturation factor